MKMGLLGIIFIILLILKLTGLLVISWFWVLSPLILAIVLFFITIIAMTFLASK